MFYIIFIYISKALTLAPSAHKKELQRFSSYPKEASIRTSHYTPSDLENKQRLYEAIARGETPTVLRIISETPRLATSQNEAGLTPLHIAVIKKNLHIAKILIQADRDSIYIQDSTGSTPIHLAIITNEDNLAMVSLLLQNPSDKINLKDTEGNTPLLLAVAQNNTPVTQLLLNHSNSDPLICNTAGMSALHISIKNKQPEISTLLIKANKACVDILDSEGNTPLHTAIMTNNPYRDNAYIVKRLLAINPDLINKQNKDGNTPLLLATSQSDVSMVQLLLTHSHINPYLKNKSEESPLSSAQKQNSLSILNLLHSFEKRIQQIPSLRPHSSPKSKSLTVKDDQDSKPQAKSQNLSPLPPRKAPTRKVSPSPQAHSEEQEESQETLTDLITTGRPYSLIARIKNGADPNSIDSQNRLPLALAVSRSGYNMVEELLYAGASPYIIDNKGNTLLHYAAANKNPRILKILLHFGVPRDVPNNLGQTPLNLIEKDIDLPAVESIQVLKTPSHPSIIPEKNRLIRTLKILMFTPNKTLREGLKKQFFYHVNKTENLNVQDTNGETALHLAVRLQDIDLVKSLIEKGANTHSQNKEGMTPLHLALKILLSKKNVRINTLRKITLLLIDKGKNLNIQDGNDDTPLHLAIQLNDSDIIEPLINKNEDLNVQDTNGETALHLAVRLQDIDLVKSLIEKGASTHSQNKEGIPLLEQGANTHSQNKEGIPLLEQGANTHSQNKEGMTPLHLALKILLDKKNVRTNKLRKIALLLIDKGEILNIQDGNGDTPLHLAAELNNDDIIKALIKQKASPQLQNKKEQLALPLHLWQRYLPHTPPPYHLIFPKLMNKSTSKKSLKISA